MHMKRRSFLALTVFIIALLPSVATAAVIMNNPVSLNTTANNTNPVYLAQASGYSTAHQMGYLGLTGSGSTTGSQTLYLNATPGSGNAVLMNVLQVVNSSSAAHSSVMLYINGTLPSGVSVYYSSSKMAYSGSAVIGGTLLKTNTGIHLDSPSLYLSIVLSGSLQSVSGQQLTFQSTYS